MRTSSPRASPGAKLLFVALAGLLVCVSAVFWSTQQPWLGLRLALGPGGPVIQAVSPDGPAASLAPGTALKSVGPIALEADDLIEEPDFFRYYERMQRFFARQSALHEQLSGPPVKLTVADAGGAASAVLLTPAESRPIADLPLPFWFQLGCGLASLLIGAWVWVLRPANWGARMFALTGALFLVSVASAAVYSSRELALDGGAFRLLSGLNHTGSLGFGMALVAMFLCYPKRIVAPRTLLLIPAVFVPWLATDLLQLAPDQHWGIRAPILLMVGIAFACAAVQWRLTRNDPRARGALRWMSLSATLGCWLFVITIVLSKLLGWLPPLDQGYAFGFFLIIYVGTALGLRRYRLFELDRWAFRVLLWVGGALALLTLDALLVLSLRLAPAPSLGVAVLIVGLLYLPVRNHLWKRMVDRRRLADDELFQAVMQVAFTSSPDERAQAWRALVQRMFDPLELEAIGPGQPAGRAKAVQADTASPDAPAILSDGLAMRLPPVAASPALLVRYPWQGRQLFGVEQAKLAGQVVALMRHADASRDAYERGVAEERLRLARDLHDDLGARLLASLKRPDLESTRRTIREAIAEMRTVVAGLSSESEDLGACIASLRHETASRLDTSGIELDWPLTDGVDGLRVDYRICKNLSSMHRELVSNVLRHSQADRLAVSIELKDGRLVSRIRDNGVGGVDAQGDDNFGLRNLRRRIDELQGSVSVRDAAPGTLVEIEVPIAAAGGRQ